MRLFVVLWGFLLLMGLASCDLVELSLISTCDLFSLSQFHLNCCELFCLTHSWFSVFFFLLEIRKRTEEPREDGVTSSYSK